jgi:hypothetical protein
MIQFRRGSTGSWRNTKVKLAAGQPGYDKDKHKIKVGDGDKLWSELPYASGLFTNEIIDSEANASAREHADTEDKTIITYGTEAPTENTVGRLYLQQSSNTDYLIESGISNGWVYQIYNSGIMTCFGTFKVRLDITDSIENTGLYCSAGNFSRNYPKTFKNPPSEVVSVQSSSGLTWIVSKGVNTTSSSGSYSIISPTSANNIEYIISIQVEGIKQ